MAGIKIEESLSSKEYHANKAISKSRLDRIHKSIESDQVPWGEPTASMILGSALHTAFLERDKFEDEYYVIKGMGLKKDFVSDYLSKHKGCKKKDADLAWDDHKKEHEELNEHHKGKTLLTENQLETVGKMVDKLASFPVTKKLFEDGKPEVSLFWDQLDIECKARPDWVTERKGDGRYLIDLKTTLDASPEGFPRSVLKYRYHVQAAWYLKAARICYGEEIADFIFLVVENKPPYSVGAYTLGPASLDEGWSLADQDLRKYKAWLDDPDHVPTGYIDSIQQIDIPPSGFTQF